MSGFYAAAEAHARRYPAMEAQDFGKLAYQNEFGPAHLAADLNRVLDALRAECAHAPESAPPPEEIGNGLCRFHLSARNGGAEAPLLARLFLLTAEGRRGSGSMDRFLEKLDRLDGLGIPGWAAWKAAYRTQGCPVLSHSEAYREAYRPHYRLLERDFAGYFPALAALDALAGTGKPAVVAIDGRCGSGKTGFAALAEAVIPCQVVHTDDFYLPFGQRAPDWEETPAGNMDLWRLEEVLVQASLGELERYVPFDCQTGQMGAPVELAGCPLTLVEGSYSHHPALADAYGWKIFLTCSEEVQTRRLKAREGAYFPAFESRWRPMEERYFRTFRIEEHAGLVVDTSAFFT